MIFVSYAWNNDISDEKILEFVEFLRKNGYETKCDVMIRQEETAIHFPQMMAKALKEAEKIIIILSENYKIKADNFQGGVGEEYQYIIADFPKNKNKYILVSFNGRNEKIIPDFIKGRDIVDLGEDKKNNYNGLFAKLSGISKYEFSPVAEYKTIPSSKHIESDNFNNNEDLVGVTLIFILERLLVQSLEKPNKLS